MGNGGSEHTTLKAGAPLTSSALYEFPRPVIQDALDGAAAQVPQPNECTDIAWRLFGSGIAAAIGAPSLSTAFVTDFAWSNVHAHLLPSQVMTVEKRRRFWTWFVSGAVPQVGLDIGETLATWMTNGIVPTLADVDKLPRKKRLQSAEIHLRRYGRIIMEVAEIPVEGGDLLRGGIEPSTSWDNALYMHGSVAWTDANQAMTKLLLPLRQGPWEYAWSVVRQLVECIVTEELKEVANQLIEWGLRRTLNSLVSGRANIRDMMMGTYQEGVQIGCVTGKMEEYLRWACQGHLGVLMAEALRDRDKFPKPLPDPALHLLEVWKLGLWPIGLKGQRFCVHDLFPVQVIA